MKNIMIVHSSLIPGGAEKMITYLANLLSKKYNVYFVFLENKERFFKLDEKVIPVQLNYDMSTPIKQVGYIKFSIILSNIVKDIILQIKKNDIHLVIAFKDRESLFSWIATRLTGKKILLSHRGDPYEKTFVWQYLLKWMYKKCDGVVFQLKTVQDYYQISVRRSTVIPNPAFEIKSHRKYNKEDYSILSAGRFQDIKKFDILIKAFSIVHAVYPKYKLYIYGDGSERKKLEKLVIELGLSDNVFMPGMMKNVIERNMNMKMFVFTSKTEGMPNILIEALSAGLPCIATKCSPGGAEFLMDYGNNGILVNVDDVNELAKAMIIYINQCDLAEEYGKKGREFIKKLNISKIDKMWFEFIDAILI